MDLTPGAAPAPEPTPERRRSWPLAIALSIGLSIVSAVLSTYRGSPLALAFAWGPLAAVAVMLYLLPGPLLPAATAPARMPWTRLLAGLVLLAAGTVYAISRLPWGAKPDDFVMVSMIHLPALAWLTVGWVILGPRAATPDVFGAVLKSVEAVIVAGLMAGAGAVFVGISLGLFQVIRLEIPDPLKRYLVYGGPALIPVLAVATVYDPDRPPSEQHRGQGLARIIFTTGRLFLPLTLLVLAVYVIAIPFRFMEPFRSRNVLVVFNAMLFAVIALLVVATPQQTGSLEARREALLRRAMIGVAGLATLVSLFAMTAVIYRTVQGGLTMNRLTVIGWNTVNIVTLVLLVVRQSSARGGAWIEASHRAFRFGLLGYAGMTLFVLFVIPFLFRAVG